jgi:predicted small secreted protein
MSKVIAWLMLGAVVATATACSTISGFGKDIEAVGGGVAAEPAKNKH